VAANQASLWLQEDLAADVLAMSRLHEFSTRC
jgi:hypothetical protein